MPSDVVITSGDEDAGNNNSSNSGDVRNASTSSESSLKYLCAQLFRKEIIKPPTLYIRGNDIDIHLKKVEEYLEITGITSDGDKVYILLESLQDELQKDKRRVNL